jgi:hypothetical protein
LYCFSYFITALYIYIYIYIYICVCVCVCVCVYIYIHIPVYARGIYILPPNILMSDLRVDIFPTKYEESR